MRWAYRLALIMHACMTFNFVQSAVEFEPLYQDILGTRMSLELYTGALVQGVKV